MKRIALILTAALLAGSDLPAEFVLAGKGVAPAVLAVPAQQTKQFRPAALRLQKFCRRITGEELKIAPSARGKRVEFALSKKLDEDGFSVTFPRKDVMLITGGTPRALEYAAFELLERFAGCRWLYIGEEGDEVPEADRIVIPEKPFSETPAFLSRGLSFRWTPLIERYGNDWIVKLRRSVATRRVRFHHNLNRLFDPGVFGKSHPEFYQVLHGKRFDVLDPKIRYRWQPCFTAPGLAEAAAERIFEEFKKSPRRDYSLGVNDIDTFCECPECEKLDGRRTNIHGFRDRTASYFRFCNKVAELVTKKYPEAKLGFLAYENMVSPPKGKMHPALVPFITYDRMQWLIPEKRKQDQALTGAWREKGAKEIGWYDYIYGGRYQLPRMYLRLMQKYLQWAHRNGVRHYYAEIYLSDDCNEGPKAYAFMKMLWNPYLDLEKLLDDWYVKAVGPKAAPYLKEYFDRIEEFWTKRAWKDNPFFRVNYTYLDFNSNVYLNNYTEAELDRSAKLLDKVVELATNRKRAELFRQGFRDREKNIRGYLRNMEVARNSGKYKFDTVLYKEDFTRGVPGSWQSRKGKFIHSKNEGIDGTPCAVMDLEGSMRGSMSYLIYPDMKDFEYFKATVRYKVTGVPPQKQVHPDHWLATKVGMSISWQGSAAADPYSPKIDWLPRINDGKVRGEIVPDGKWRTMTVYARRPLLPVKRMVVLLTAGSGFKGKIYFDDFELRGAK